jgi:hypothetical protein
VVQGLLAAQTPIVTIFGKSWDFHVEIALKTTLEENLRMIADTVSHLKSCGRRVFYDAEHFFDGFKANAEYALDTLQAAVRAGAETLILCDTNGGALPERVSGGGGAGAVADASGATGDSLPQRWGAGGGQLACRGRGGRDPRPGGLQRLRRAVRKRQPLLGHPEYRVEARPAVLCRRAS